MRRERGMELQVEALHELIDQLVIDEDGNSMAGLQRLDLHRRVDEMSEEDRADPSRWAMLLSKEDAGTVEEVDEGLTDRTDTRKADGTLRTITDQPRREESRTEKRNRTKKRLERSRNYLSSEGSKWLWQLLGNGSNGAA